WGGRGAALRPRAFMRVCGARERSKQGLPFNVPPTIGDATCAPRATHRRCIAGQQHYRPRAQQCLEMARAFGDRDARVTLAYMAQAWLRLADNCQDAKK